MPKSRLRKLTKLAKEMIVVTIEARRTVSLMRLLGLVCSAAIFACASFVPAGAASAVKVAAAGSPAPKMLARSSEMRVMALGDSITAGVGANGSRIDDGGYRGALAKLLTRNGYRVRFVGSRSDYSAAIDERAHEGWPGYVLRSFPSDPGPGQLYGALVRKAIRRYDPDLILLMAGTNDLLRLEKRDGGYTLANIAHSMDLLLGEIFKQNRNVRVIVAPVVSSPLVDVCTLAHFDGVDSACGPSETENLATLVRNYSSRGYQITLARAMAGAVPRDRDHFPDGIHPCGAGGYAAVASAWYQAISAVTGAPTDAALIKPTDTNYAKPVDTMPARTLDTDALKPVVPDPSAIKP
jgi:lysophospholipase L1-like esterase